MVAIAPPSPDDCAQCDGTGGTALVTALNVYINVKSYSQILILIDSLYLIFENVITKIIM